MNTMKRLQYNNTARKLSFDSAYRTGTIMSEYSHIIYIKYASGWEKNLVCVNEDQIENAVKSLFEKGCYKVYVRELNDPMRKTEKAYTK